MTPTPEALEQATKIATRWRHDLVDDRLIDAIAGALDERARGHAEHLALCVEASAKANRERLALEDLIVRQMQAFEALEKARVELEGQVIRQAQAHEACIAEIQADALAMAHRENELHDEKDKTLAEQAREMKKWRDEADEYHQKLCVEIERTKGQAREIDRLKTGLDQLQLFIGQPGDLDYSALVAESARQAQEIARLTAENETHVQNVQDGESIRQKTWEAAADRLAEELHKTPETRIDVWAVVEDFRARASAQGGSHA